MTSMKTETENKATKTLAAFKLPDDLLQELRDMSEQVGEPQSLIVRQALRQKLDELNKQAKTQSNLLI